MLIYDTIWNRLLKELAAVDCVVYDKPPFGDTPAQVVEYLGLLYLKAGNKQQPDQINIG